MTKRNRLNHQCFIAKNFDLMIKPLINGKMSEKTPNAVAFVQDIRQADVYCSSLLN